MSFLSKVLDIVKRVPSLDRTVSQQYINYLATRTTPRPRPYSLWSSVDKPSGLDQQGPISDYTSWPALTNKKFSGRHLPPAEQAYTSSLPIDRPYDPGTEQWGAVTSLFQRKGPMVVDRSSLLFMFFAQWFTDSILRTDPVDRRKNTSNHDIDLCQIYGLDEGTARLLRSNDKGRLRSQIINGEECLDYLGEPDGADGWKVKDRYKALPYAEFVDKILSDVPAGLRAARREKLYATGLERGNSSVGYVAISTVFMREHNRICGELSERNPGWDDERIFQTARMINIVLLLKLVVEDYINHITDYHVFRLDATFAEKKSWYRPNWIAVEFDLLYRWHGLVPDAITVNEKLYLSGEFRNNNALLEQVGVGAIITSASGQAAGRIGLGNTPSFLWGAEYQSIKMSRDFRLRSYNDYRQQFGLDRLSDFGALTSDAQLQGKLRALYGDIDRVEFLVGLFAEDRESRDLFGSLMVQMVAYDAFTQIFTNPLLSTQVFHADTFTHYGLDLIESTRTIQDLVKRNVSHAGDVRASLAAR